MQIQAEMQTIRAEITDTFGGEANYSWVRRVEFISNKSKLAIIRKVKKYFSFNGCRARTEDFGEYIAIRPNGINVVIFIEFGEWKEVTLETN